MSKQLSLFSTTASAAGSGPEERNRLGSSDVLAQEGDDSEPEDEESIENGRKPESNRRWKYLNAGRQDGGDAAEIAEADIEHEFPPRG